MFVCHRGALIEDSLAGVLAAVACRIPELQRSAFGHLVLPFEASTDGDDVEVRVPVGSLSPLATGLRLLPPATTELAEPFARLARDLDSYFDANNTYQTAFDRLASPYQLVSRSASRTTTAPLTRAATGSLSAGPRALRIGVM